jgi:hypothetical protein
LGGELIAIEAGSGKRSSERTWPLIEWFSFEPQNVGPSLSVEDVIDVIVEWLRKFHNLAVTLNWCAILVR